ncbi:MAG: RnfABCDGE type electron transport complex subunit G [Clostridiales bacterium]|nr:RnfABCDGE type electron transport complex subunit G [Clostridiales bacterium]MDD7350237.1 RnfABCDGE type electron transport complex subunit G [Clostridiales bacterium]MDY3773557.1 RnfABCDGE type electron transport complex subunit G [Eubacterium sp.]
MSSEKKERSFVIDAIILCAITLVLGGILAGVYTMTKGTIEQRQADTDSKACEKVISSVEGATVAEADKDAVTKANDFLTKHILNSSKEVSEEASESYSKYVTVTTVKKLQISGADVGYVYIADAKKGYGGSISFVLGVCNGVVTGIEITSQSETAGLGANCESDNFKNKFALEKGLQYPSSDDIPMFYKAGTTPKDEQGQIEAMSGATVTSRAIANAVKGILYYDKELRGAE